MLCKAYQLQLKEMVSEGEGDHLFSVAVVLLPVLDVSFALRKLAVLEIIGFLDNLCKSLPLHPLLLLKPDGILTASMTTTMTE